MTSCVEENFKGNLTIVDGEVSFTASLRKTHMTKTSYGDIGTDNKQEVFWVHGDEITVYGADCNIPQANYAVSVANPDSEGNLVINKEQNYATGLDKTTPYGVQWGNVVKTDYYAVYPSTGNKFVASGVTKKETTTAEGNKAVEVTTKSATVTASINTIQNVDFKLYDTGQKDPLTNKNILGWKGVHYASNVHNPTSVAALMYACTRGAEAADENGNPKTVDLQFQPFSTVLRFSFDGFVVKDENNVNVDYNSAVYVDEIVLEAPYKVAGDFNLTINNDAVYDESGKITKSPTAIAEEGTSNTISIVPSVRIPLETHQKVEFDVFTIPQTYTMSATQLWTVTLKTTGGDKKYKLIPKIIENDKVTPTSATLVAGQIHNLTIPALSIKRPEVQIPDGSWIEYIPRNVYLSELSMPGAWYATSSAYQGNVSLSDLYGIGVRAFNIDCRVSYDSVEKPRFSDTHTYSETMSLVCAGTETSSASVGLLSKLTYTQGTSVKSKIEELIPKVSSKEYIVLVLTIAEKPKMHNYGTGDYEFGTVEPKVVLEYITTMIDELRNSYKDEEGESIIYDKVITSNTTVNDVLGHMIIKVNVNTSYDKFKSYTTLPSTLLSEASMASEYSKGDIVGSSTNTNLFKVRQDRTIYWGKADDNLNLTYKFHQAQLTLDNTQSSSTSSTPSLYDRDSTVNKDRKSVV